MFMREALNGLALVAMLIGPSANAQTAPRARATVAQGELTGTSSAFVRTFLGVPFAQPPLGQLRWRPPTPLSSWTGVKDATHFGDDCMQPTSMLTRLSRAPGMSEDCLTLNVWAPPQRHGTRLPVMVWIYGGSFIGGSASAFDGSALARKGVIVVAANYRGGLFGFLAHSQLSAESDHHVSGNYGLLDQMAALQWVKRNIASFGGDPDAVTIFGESAGASAISLLMTSPLAKGLFTRAILQSPGAMRPMNQLASAEATDSVVGSDIAALRALPARDLLAMTGKLIPKERSLSRPRVLGPIVDGWIVPLDERVAYRTGAVAHVPIIIGGNADEGRLFVQSWSIKTEAQFAALIGDDFGVDAPEIKRLYSVKADAEVPGRLSELFGDTQFNLGYDGVANAMSSLGIPVYRYRFSHIVNAQPPTHGDEIRFVFAQWGGDPRSSADRSISDAMMDAWVGFARTGNPGSIASPWPRYSSAQRAYLDFGETAIAGMLAPSPRIDFLACLSGARSECRER